MTIRRRRNSDARRIALVLAAGYRCPDCDAETHLDEDAPGVMVLDVEHDPTCPAYTAMTSETA
jgi:hypothetical protein